MAQPPRRLPWFRFYWEVLYDPKIQQLTPTLRCHWLNVLCLAAKHEGSLPDMKSMAYELRMSEGKVRTVIYELIKNGLLDGDEERGLSPHNWGGRQYRDEAAESAAKSGSFGNHKRWHLDRGIVAPGCSHCIANPIGGSESLSDTHLAISLEADTETEADQKQIQNKKQTRDLDEVSQIVSDFSTYGKANAGTVRSIEYAIKDFGVEWVGMAVRKGMGASFEGLPGWNYVESILERWQKNGGPDEPVAFERKQLGRNGANVGESATATTAELERLGLNVRPPFVLDPGGAVGSGAG